MTYLWTTIPFLLFLLFLFIHEKRHKKIERRRSRETEKYLHPLATVTGNMFKEQYGRASSQMEQTFPEVHQAK